MVKNGQKWPQNDQNDVIVKNNDWNLFILQIWCIFRQFKDGVFEKNALLCSTISAQKGHFWSPEGLNLAKKLENGVFSVHTIQNLTFWNPNVAPKFFENFGPTDPP